MSLDPKLATSSRLADSLCFSSPQSLREHARLRSRRPRSVPSGGRSHGSQSDQDHAQRSRLCRLHSTASRFLERRLRFVLPPSSSPLPSSGPPFNDEADRNLTLRRSQVSTCEPWLRRSTRTRWSRSSRRPRSLLPTLASRFVASAYRRLGGSSRC